MALLRETSPCHHPAAFCSEIAALIEQFMLKQCSEQVAIPINVNWREIELQSKWQFTSKKRRVDWSEKHMNHAACIWLLPQFETKIYMLGGESREATGASCANQNQKRFLQTLQAYDILIVRFRAFVYVGHWLDSFVLIADYLFAIFNEEHLLTKVSTFPVNTQLQVLRSSQHI